MPSVGLHQGDVAIQSLSGVAECSRELLRAFTNREFFLDYQPIISLRTDSMSGAEALVRWRHPERGTVMPDAFIPAAEDSGLIVPIGMYVLEQACRQLDIWRRAGLPVLPLSVNVSAVQLLHRDFVEAVTTCLETYSVKPGEIKLEVTETARLDDSAAVIGRLRELRGIGVGILLDDFGTGYSSLSRLMTLPVNGLKFDRGFTRGVPDDPIAVAILSHIAALARDLGLSLVVEGVESARQVEWLRRFPDVDVQGHYYSMPVPASDLFRFHADAASFS